MIRSIPHFFKQIAAFCSLPLILIAANFIDEKWEVVGLFRVDTQLVSDNGVYISGAMDKQRRCSFLEAVALNEHGALYPVDFVDMGGRKVSRPTGPQQWGPWFIPGVQRGEVIRLEARHTCHALWDHSEPLTTFRVGAE